MYVIEYPKKVTLNFNSPNIDILKKQENNINENDLPFIIEKQYSKDIHSNSWVSFSQMINESIQRSNNEFIIFINPKVILNTEDIKTIIEKLCSGYCFASIIGFAFFGITKELVRSIGMLDERFLSADFEDDDFFIRLKIFNKKFYWGHDLSKYDYYLSYNNIYRGSSQSLFFKKWSFRDNLMIINPNTLVHKKLFDNKNNDEIRLSWGDGSESYWDGCVATKYDEVQIKYSEELQKVETENFNIFFELNDGVFFCQIISDFFKSGISVSLLETHINGRTSIVNYFLPFGFWYKHFNLDVNKKYELRFYMDGSIIYTSEIKNKDKLTLPFCLPITKFLYN